MQYAEPNAPQGGVRTFSPPSPSANMKGERYTMTSKTISIDELYNNHLDNIEDATGKAVTLMQIIGGHFEPTEEALQKDEFLAYCYKSSYSEIQSLLFILFDYIWAIKKEMETVMKVDVVPNKATA